MASSFLSGVVDVMPKPGGKFSRDGATGGVRLAEDAIGKLIDAVTAIQQVLLGQAELDLTIKGHTTFTAPTDTTKDIVSIEDAGAGRTGPGQVIILADHIAAPIWSVPPAGGPATYGDNTRTGPNVFGPFVEFDGTTNPPCLRYNSGARYWIGQTGAPTATLAAVACNVGDRYQRIDTPTTTNQREYICTVAGTPGTWVGIL